jgi:outer membrane protein assembly factor BamB
MSLNSSAIVVDDTLYVVDTRYWVSALSTVDGSELWSEELDLTGQVVDSPVVLNGSLYIVTSLEAEQGHVARVWAFTGSTDTDRAAGESS